jgi:hypothetical protein
MLVRFTFQLTSPALGHDSQTLMEAPAGRSIFRFPRRKEMWQIDAAWWAWLLAEAASSLQLPLVLECVQPPKQLALPSLHLYFRNKSAAPPKGKRSLTAVRDKAEHECLRGGTRLTCDFEINVNVSPLVARTGRRAPTLQDVRKLFEYIGHYMGISPFGAHLGYGRFKVISLEPLTPHE